MQVGLTPTLPTVTALLPEPMVTVLTMVMLNIFWVNFVKSSCCGLREGMEERLGRVWQTGGIYMFR